MSEPFIAEIRMFGFNFAPMGWAFCNGQILPIQQNTALYSVIGAVYGGDGRTTFGLPNLQGSAPLDMGQGAGLTARTVGQKGGAANVTLTAAQMPTHTHAASAASTAGTVQTPAGNVWALAQAARQPQSLYGTAAGASMNAQAFSAAGGTSAHNNLMPYLVLNFCIALEGIFPSRG